jgi:hypothetical protein
MLYEEKTRQTSLFAVSPRMRPSMKAVTQVFHVTHEIPKKSSLFWHSLTRLNHCVRSKGVFCTQSAGNIEVTERLASTN